jgi:hypothetical protein
MRAVDVRRRGRDGRLPPRAIEPASCRLFRLVGGKRDPRVDFTPVEVVNSTRIQTAASDRILLDASR